MTDLSDQIDPRVDASLAGQRNPNECGVIFVASGARYIACAKAAALSVRQHSPALPIVLFTDAGKPPDTREDEPFDRVIQIEDPHERSKVDCIGKSPFGKTLYLDADVRVLADIADLFEVLERFDIAIAHAHARNRTETLAVWKKALPDCFPQFNSGVIAVRRNDRTEALLQDWSQSYRVAGFRKDQVTLRELLWASDLRIATLPPEYNIRYSKYLWLWARREARPRICHFHRYSFDSWGTYLCDRLRQVSTLPRRIAYRLVVGQRSK